MSLFVDDLELRPLLLPLPRLLVTVPPEPPEHYEAQAQAEAPHQQHAQADGAHRGQIQPRTGHSRGLTWDLEHEKCQQRLEAGERELTLCRDLTL